jgi:hypothetical protein
MVARTHSQAFFGLPRTNLRPKPPEVNFPSRTLGVPIQNIRTSGRRMPSALEKDEDSIDLYEVSRDDDDNDMEIRSPLHKETALSSLGITSLQLAFFDDDSI